jgi:hypothetical protein
VSEGAFTRDGDFVTLWTLDTDAICARFREHVLQELQRAERLSDDFAEKLRSWNPSGFEVYAGRQTSMGETRRIEELGRYMTRPPLPQDRVELLPDGRALVPTPPDPRTGATEIVLDPLELVHRIVMQIPDRGAHGVRYYGAYSCRARRARAERAPADDEGEQADAPLAAATEDQSEQERQRRRTWARLIRHVFEIDPLLCEQCGGEMRIISVITDPPVVQRILKCVERKQAGPDPP